MPRCGRIFAPCLSLTEERSCYPWRRHTCTDVLVVGPFATFFEGPTHFGSCLFRWWGSKRPPTLNSEHETSAWFDQA